MPEAPAAALPPSPSPARPDAPLLAADALAVRRGERLLFKGLGFTLAAGEVIWLRGANGRGKTSLLRVLAGLSPPAHGELRLRGRPAADDRAAYARGLLYIAHANALKDDLTVLESLQFMARLHGHDGAVPACRAALERLGIANRESAPVRTLSQGQRRRVALARLALGPRRGATAPALWLLDEPYDALDTEGVARLDGLLTEHAMAGGGTVLTSHLALTLARPAPRELLLAA